MYFRKCIEKDREQILAYVCDEPSFNLFIIGDIEAFGFEEAFQEIWACFDDADIVHGVLLRFNESFIPYWKDEAFDVTAFVNCINDFRNSVDNDGNTKEQKGLILSGKERIMSKMHPFFPELTPKPTYFCELNSTKMLPSVDKEVKIAVEADAERIFQLMETIDEFKISVPPARIAHKIKTKTGRIYYKEDLNGNIISVAQTSAENSLSAMIVGVATHRDHRGQGLMSACLSQLCSDLLQEGKSLCLFYDNPSAGKIYHRIGFQTIGQWVMLQ